MTDSAPQSGTSKVARLLTLRPLRPLQSMKTVLAAGVSVLLVALLSLVFIDRDLSAARTYVTSAKRADVQLANGSQAPARIGALVPPGATLLTGRYGAARLTTGGRDVYLGALSSVKVVNGLRQELARGLVMIDARGGPGLSVATTSGAGTVSAPAGALARVEQNIGTLRLAVYQGHAAITAEGRQAKTSVDALHQVRIPYFGIPEPQTALALTITNGRYDGWEQRMAADLVQADIDLNSFSTGLNGVDGLFVLNAAPASLRQSAPSGRTRGEQALAVAVAQKGRLHDDPRANLQQVERDRGDSGSWGVVAAIVKAAVSDVTSVLGNSLDAPGNPGTLASGLVPGRTSGPTSSSPGGQGGSGQPSQRPTATTSPSPTVTPTSPGPITKTVKDLLNSLSPTPPAPSPPPTPGAASDPLVSLVRALLTPLLP